MYTASPRIRQENYKTRKMRHTHCVTWIIVRNSEKHENEKYTLQERGYGKKTDQQGK
jgi:hypothetical protein